MRLRLIDLAAWVLGIAIRVEGVPYGLGRRSEHALETAVRRALDGRPSSLPGHAGNKQTVIGVHVGAQVVPQDCCALGVGDDPD